MKHIISAIFAVLMIVLSVQGQFTDGCAFHNLVPAYSANVSQTFTFEYLPGDQLTINYTGSAPRASVQFPTGTEVGTIANGGSFTYIVANTISEWTISAGAAQSLSGTVSCIPNQPIPDTSDFDDNEPAIVYPPDNRINWQFGDTHIAIFYPGANGTIDLYTYDNNRYYPAFITPEIIAYYLDSPVERPILLKEEGLVRVYILPSGRILFILGPDSEGKIYSIRLDDLTDRDLSHSTYFDPNE